ncbi:unnamed protein product [Lactuca saligna]|uniref:Reverse transcriptase zinc-binding domain-containing protein n=1 Tax=Lactuca saligna TaxID=75948 RepID=A0AA35YTF0_LACSI|nr:unnamed protein product [Lactuca saligna]
MHFRSFCFHRSISFGAFSFPCLLDLHSLVSRKIRLPMLGGCLPGMYLGREIFFGIRLDYGIAWCNIDVLFVVFLTTNPQFVSTGVRLQAKHMEIEISCKWHLSCERSSSSYCQRGINISSSSCQMCSNGVDIVHHSLLECPVAVDSLIWIFNWCGIPFQRQGMTFCLTEHE